MVQTPGLPTTNQTPSDEADVLVSGGTGLVGRWILAELTARGRGVVAIVRGADRRADSLRSWVDAHGGDGSRLRILEGDVGHEDLGLGPDRTWLESIRTLFSLAGRIEFGMGVDEARAVNVTGAVRLLEAAAAGGLDRVVHVSGYRVGDLPVQEPFPTGIYEERGAYEASKAEADWAMRHRAAELGVAWTILNPSSVIGDSRTGETTQMVGLADTLHDLFAGRLPALVGGPRVLLPVVAVDYLASFAVEAAARPEGIGRSFWVLDDGTPRLPELVGGVAAHMGVRAPKANLPTALVRRMPKALTKVEPDSLEFLVPDDDYPTEGARSLAVAAGLEMPDTWQTLGRWADHLVSTRFLAEEPAIPGRFESAGSSRAFVRRRGDDPALVCLHGIPFDSDAWLDVLASVTSDVVAPDLPGLGRSAPSPLPPAVWLSHLAPETPSIIAGHSLGCEYAVRFAVAHPDRVRELVLVSPFFLQAAPSSTLRAWPLVAATLARATEARLRARLLDGAPGADEALRSAAANLTRRGVARRTARTLAAVASRRHRAELRSMLATLDIPVTVVHGSADRLVVDPPPAARITTIEGTGHNPHLTHPADTAKAIRAALG